MVTKTGNVDVGTGDRTDLPKCFGKLFDATVAECKICDHRAPCQNVTQGAGKMSPNEQGKPEEKSKPEAEAPPATPPAEAPPATPPAEAPPATPPAEQAAPPATPPSDRKKIQAPAHDALKIRADTAGAYALVLLGQKFWKPSDLADEVRKVCGGKGSKAYDMVNRAKRADLLLVEGEGRNRTYKLKPAPATTG